MSIASGFTKMKNYILTSSGYKLLSRWTSSQTVHMGDGTDDTDTVEYRFGAMKGITSSLATDNDEFALSASAGKNLQDQCTQLNQRLTTFAKLYEGIVNLVFGNTEFIVDVPEGYVVTSVMLDIANPALGIYISAFENTAKKVHLYNPSSDVNVFIVIYANIQKEI